VTDHIGKAMSGYRMARSSRTGDRQSGEARVRHRLRTNIDERIGLDAGKSMPSRGCQSQYRDSRNATRRSFVAGESVLGSNRRQRIAKPRRPIAPNERLNARFSPGRLAAADVCGLPGCAFGPTAPSRAPARGRTAKSGPPASSSRQRDPGMTGFGLYQWLA